MAFATTTVMVPTPSASVTVAEGRDTASLDFYQRVTGNVAIVYSGVPAALALNIMQNSDPDTAIRVQLSSYPKRIIAV